MDKQKDFEKGWEEYKAKRNKEIEEIARIISPCSKSNCADCVKTKRTCIDYFIANKLYNAGYRKIPENAVVLTREEYDELKERIDELEQLLLVTKTNAKLTHKKEIEQFAEKLKRKHHEYYPNVPYEEFVKANIVCGDIDEICKEIMEGKK